MAKKSSTLGLTTIDPTREGVLQGYKNLNAMNSALAGKEYATTALPYELKDEFKKRQDPALNEKISKSEQAMLGGYTAGLYKFQDISNPFQRRALSQQYKGNLSMTYDSLTAEKDRRTGKYLDYIEKYTGLFSADIARERAMINSYQEQIGQAKEMWRTDVEDKRYEEEKAKSGSAASAKNYTEKEITSTISKLKAEGMGWDQIAESLRDAGVDITTGSYSDVQLNSAFDSGNYPVKPTATSSKPQSEKEKYQEEEYQRYNDVYSSAKKSRSEAKKGELYMDSEGNIRKRSFGFAKNDEIVQPAI